MGVVYSPESVWNHEVPSADGTDHLKAARLVFDSIAGHEATADTTRILILGSVVTGQANRRSDIDYFMARKPLEGEIGVRQQLHIQSALHTAQKKYHVHFEGQQFTENEISWIGHKIGDPLWAAHCSDIEDNYPHWSHRAPFERLREYAIDIDNLSKTTNRSRVGEAVLNYYKNKINLFNEAGEFESSRAFDLMLMQRALESPKAYARKAMAISALEGIVPSTPDVTSKSDMRAKTDELLERIDSGGQMKIANDLVDELDQEYGQILDDAVDSGEIDRYVKWLDRNYLVACAGALRLGQLYLDYADKVTFEDPTIIFDEPFDYLEDAEVQGSSTESITIPPQKLSDPVLINLSKSELDEIIYAAGQRTITAKDGAKELAYSAL